MELNRDQVVKVLECCASPMQMCKDCPMPEETKDDCRCMETISRNTLALIKKLTKENERLIAENKALVNENAELKNQIQDEIAEEDINLFDEFTKLLNEGIREAKSDTVRKMHTEIKERCIKGGIYPAFVARTIENVAKEMLEEET